MRVRCATCGYTKDNDGQACPVCKSNSWEDMDKETISKISKDSAFINAMLDLRDKDPIEYELKMVQFRNQMEQQKSMRVVNEQTNTRSEILCPTCGSNNIKRISTSAKIGGALMFGLLSKTAKSQFECTQCGYKW